MSHHASGNWGNQRTNPEKGIQSGPHQPVRRVVALLLASAEGDAIGFVRRHSGNRAWLEMAMEIEGEKRKPNKAVLDAIRAALAPPSAGVTSPVERESVTTGGSVEKPLPRRQPLDTRACKDG